MSESIEVYFRIPYPSLSGNNQYEKSGKGMRLRQEVIEYRDAVRAVLHGLGVAGLKLTGPIWVETHARPPRRGRFDQCNLEKVTWDALTKADVWVDDSNLVIPCSIFRWYPPESPGSVSMWLRTYEGDEDEEEEMQAAAGAAAAEAAAVG